MYKSVKRPDKLRVIKYDYNTKGAIHMKNTEENQNVVNIETLIEMLDEKDNSSAYQSLQELERISDETGLAYVYTEKFIEMIGSAQYVIRVRGFRLFCKQAKWDNDYLLDENIDSALNILKDEKPTAVRQALAALPEVVRYKPELREIVNKAVSNINYMRYKETMHSLIAKDIKMILDLIKELSR